MSLELSILVLQYYDQFCHCRPRGLATSHGDLTLVYGMIVAPTVCALPGLSIAKASTSP